MTIRNIDSEMKTTLLEDDNIKKAMDQKDEALELTLQEESEAMQGDPDEGRETHSSTFQLVVRACVGSPNSEEKGKFHFQAMKQKLTSTIPLTSITCSEL